MICEHTSCLLSVRSSGARADGFFLYVCSSTNVLEIGGATKTKRLLYADQFLIEYWSRLSISLSQYCTVFALDYSFQKDTAPFFIFHKLLNVFLTWSRFWDIIRSWTEGPRKIRGGCFPVLVCLPWPRKLLPRLRVVDKTVRLNSKEILNPEAYHGEHRKNKEKYMSIKGR